MAICHNKQYEREFVRLMNKLGIICFRIAGSGSAEEAVSDGVMYLPEPCLVEVKATKEEVFYLRNVIKEQLQKMIKISEKTNTLPVLAIKFKHRGWNIMRANITSNISFNTARCLDENSTADSIRAFLRA